MTAYNYIQQSKKFYNQLFARYHSKYQRIVEPVASSAYICGEKFTVFCHPDDAKNDYIEDFKEDYYVL